MRTLVQILIVVAPVVLGGALHCGAGASSATLDQAGSDLAPGSDASAGALGCINSRGDAGLGASGDPYKCAPTYCDPQPDADLWDCISVGPQIGAPCGYSSACQCGSLCISGVCVGSALGSGSILPLCAEDAGADATLDADAAREAGKADLPDRTRRRPHERL
jgi:hypothetical protein